MPKDDTMLSLSVALGAPIGGLIDKLNVIGPAIDDILDEHAETGQELMMLLGMYFCATAIRQSKTPETAVEDIIEVLPAIEEMLLELTRDYVAETDKTGRRR